MTRLIHPAHTRHSEQPRTLRVLRCRHCGDRFGTAEAFALHQPRPAEKRSRQLKQTGIVRRSLCASEKTLTRAGCWRGYAGVWWTVATDPETFENMGPQVLDSNVFILDKIGTRYPSTTPKPKPHNHAGSGASVSKFRRGEK